MNVLFIGDIVGKPGRICLRDMLPKIRSNYEIDFVIANGENAAGGVGITRKVFDELLSYGVDSVTSGNHIWDKKDVFEFIDSQPTLLRPLNYPAKTSPGKGFGVYKTPKGPLGIINVSGTVFMPDLDSPYALVDACVAEMRKQTACIIVDFHAETTSEKISMGWYLDGRVSAVLGTHTHVQTADERLLPEGTAYITDVGMTGAYNSVLGVKKDIVIKKFLTKLPTRFEVENKPPYQFNGVVVRLDTNGGIARSIERINDLHMTEEAY